MQKALEQVKDTIAKYSKYRKEALEAGDYKRAGRCETVLVAAECRLAVLEIIALRNGYGSKPTNDGE